MIAKNNNNNNSDGAAAKSILNTQEGVSDAFEKRCEGTPQVSCVEQVLVQT